MKCDHKDNVTKDKVGGPCQRQTLMECTQSQVIECGHVILLAET